MATLRVHPDYAGEKDTMLGAGRFSVEVSALGGNRFGLTATGELCDGSSRMAKRVLEAELSLDAAGTVVSFHETRRRDAK